MEGKNEVGSVLQHASVAVASVGGACGRGGGGLGLGQSWDRVLRRQQHDAEEGMAVQHFEMQRGPRQHELEQAQDLDVSPNTQKREAQGGTAADSHISQQR